MLLTMVPQQRGRVLREASTLYHTSADDAYPNVTDQQQLNHLLEHIPLPAP